MKTLHIFNVTNKNMFQITRTSGEFGWNLKWIDTKQIVWINSYYKSFSSVLMRIKNLENNY